MTGPILIVQTGFLGDAVLATGMIRALHDVAPGVQTGLLVRAEFIPLFEAHPAIGRLHGLHKKVPGGTMAMVEELRNCGYQSALLAHRSVRSAYICWRAGIPQRIGFRQSEAPLLLTRRVEYNIAQHEIDRNIAL